MNRAPLLTVAGLIFVFFSPAAAQRVAPGPLAVTVTAAGKPVERSRVTLGGRYAYTPKHGRVVFDGVPAGKYPLTVDTYGFERYAMTVTLPAGRREKIDVALEAVTWAVVAGTVTLADTEQPVAGALVTLTPIAVRSSARGVFRFASDGKGQFRIQRLAPGRYRAEVTSPGSLSQVSEVDIGPGETELAFRVEAAVEPAALAVKVVDATSEGAVPGARVTLAEAWPSGVIAGLEGLRIGRANWADTEGNLKIQRRRATVHVEADGYEARRVAVNLQRNTSLTARLNPTAEIAEREPNNDPGHAQPIPTGAPVRLRLAETGDHDCFRIRLEHEAQLSITFDPPGVLDREVQLLASDGKRVASHAVYANQKFRLVVPVRAGEYIVKASEWGANAVSDNVLTLTVASHETADPHEPNDTRAAARPVQPGEEIGGFILPVGDEDFFRFDAPRPGVVRISMAAHPMERSVSVLDRRGKVLGERSVYGGQTLVLEVSIGVGRHHLKITEWGNNGSSTTPYRARLDYFPGDGGDRTLRPGEMHGGTINPVGDRDIYVVALPSAGLLRLRAKAPTELTARILAADGSVLAGGSVYAGQDLVLPWSSPGPRVVRVEMSEWGDNGWSPSPYTLAAEWEPCDELEAVGSNDMLATATTVEVGEPLRGSVSPVRDQDYYLFDFDHPGHLVLRGAAPVELTVSILDGRGKSLATRSCYPGQTVAVAADVAAGRSFVQVREWGDNASHPGTYEIETVFEKAEPGETASLRHDPVRPLRLSEGASFVIDHLRDRDRFVVDVLEPGKYVVAFWPPVDTLLRLFDDRTGKLVFERAAYKGQYLAHGLEVTGPTRWRAELIEWGDNGRGDARGYVLVAPAGSKIVAAGVQASVEPTDPTRVRFALEAIKSLVAPEAVAVDADGDGKIDFSLADNGAWRYRDEGVYPAAFHMRAGGIRTIVNQWVWAVGPRERKGVRLHVDYPRQSQIIDRDEPVRARALSFTGASIRRLTVAVDGRLVNSAYSRPFAVEVPWRSFRSGEHTLRVTAEDARGESATVERLFRVSDYFALTPVDGAVMSGRDVAVTWSGTRFGQARVRYRKRGAEQWREVVGENGVNRRVALVDLETGEPYELQPVGGAEPGPVRSVTRIKGLAFGQSRYGATIARDYNQRLGISVRNHAESPMMVTLVCGKPEASRLLIGFVGEGSMDAPFELGPGEEREFMLGLSAQDVIKRRHIFAARIRSAGGYSDEAEIAIEVKLPEVKLEWQVGADLKNGLGQVLRLVNRGDPLSDLNVTSDSPDLMVTPAVSHGALRRGGTLKLTAMARLHEGFSSVKAKVTASAIDKSFSTDVELALPAGKKVYGVNLIANADPAGEDSLWEADIMTARGMAGSYLEAKVVDWSVKDRPEDTDGDGRVDRWRVDRGNVLWVGDDTDGDGEIDFVHADVGADGQYDYSAYRTKDGWEQTNLVEAWLDVHFALPWKRSAYAKHDVEILMNDRVVARLEDELPEGNYTFRLPPTAIRFDDSGVALANRVGIKSRHLRGGHYIVSSDFRIKLRLTGTRAWVVAGSEEEAQRAATQQEGLALSGPDYAVSSAEVRVTGGPQPKAGQKVEVIVPVRNVGATTTPSVTVALRRSSPGGKAVELARTQLEGVPLSGLARVRLPWTVAAGTHQLRVVVDPDRVLADPDHGNNEAMLTVEVAGDDAPPTVEIVVPANGATLAGGRLALEVKAADDSGLAAVEARVDDGLWRPLAGDGDYRALGLLQPGAHTVTVRALDSSGNRVESRVRVRSDAPPPVVEFVAPAGGTRIDARTAVAEFKVGAAVVFAAARVNGGPWSVAVIEDGVAKATVGLSYGNVRLEAMAIDSAGIRATTQSSVVCTKQRKEGEAAPVAAAPPGPIKIEGVGPVRPFGPADVIVSRVQEPAAVSLAALPEALKPGTKITYRSVNGKGVVEVELTGSGIKAICTHGDRKFTFSGPLERRGAIQDRLFGMAACEGGPPGLEVRYAITADGAQMLTKWSAAGLADSIGLFWVRR